MEARPAFLDHHVAEYAVTQWLATMKRVKDTYEQHMETILQAWENEKKAAEKKDEPKDEGGADDEGAGGSGATGKTDDSGK